MSLRARLLVGLGIVAAVLVFAAVTVTRAASAYLVDQVDDRLAAAAEDGDRDGGHGPPGTGHGYSPYYVGVIDAGSATVRPLQTPDAVPGGDAAPTPDIDPDQARAAAAGDDPCFTTGSDDPGVRYRVRATAARGGEPVTVVATSLADTDAAVSRLVAVEVLATALILGLLGLVAFWVLRLGVRPLKDMTRAAAAIARDDGTGGDLSRRVPAAPGGTEAAELGATLNRMLARIESAFAARQASEDRLRQFVGDASHELRTPVTTIRGYAELHRRGGLEDPGELAAAMRRTESEAERMAALVDDLLVLARLDQGRPVERRPVDLGVLAGDAAGDARVAAPGRTVRASTEEGVVVPGDENRLRQVLANLVRNAVVHTPPGTTVRVAVHRDRYTGAAVAEVSDDGPGMTAEQAAHAFDRFYRADPGRSRDRGGSGLGLAIVEAVALAHGGRAVLDTAPGRGTTVRVELPSH